MADKSLTACPQIQQVLIKFWSLQMSRIYAISFGGHQDMPSF